MTGTVILLIVLLGFSAYFAGAEIAFFSIGAAKTQALLEEGRKGSRALHDIKAKPERLLITISIGNNVANIAAAAVATYTATLALGSAGVGIATGVMTLLVLFFGEITPKSFAAKNAVAIALLSAPVFLGLNRLLFFLVIPLEAVTRAMLRNDLEAAPSVTEEEIRAMTRMGHQEGSIETHERELIERVFTLDSRRVWEVMTPRVDIFAWEDSRRLAQIAAELPRVPFSRIPVYGNSPDDVTGVLYVRDAYQALVAGQRDIPLEALAREPLFVPTNVPIIQLLRDFQSRRVHMGIIVDEHGGIDGLITLEDILEEIVGEIVDETDIPDEPIVRISRNEIVVEGGADLREINHFFNIAFPLLEHRSLNGYLLEEMGRVPVAGEVIRREGVRIEVLDATGTQVTRARLTRELPVGSGTGPHEVGPTGAEGRRA